MLRYVGKVLDITFTWRLAFFKLQPSLPSMELGKGADSTITLVRIDGMAVGSSLAMIPG